MASPYLTAGSGGGGSAYLDAGSGGGGAAPAKKGGGGILGGIEHAAHAVTSKLALAGHDLRTIPGGLAQLGTAEYKALKVTATHPFGKLTPQQHADLHAPDTLVKGMAAQTAQSFEHPLRDPFLTAVNALPLFRLAGGAALRGVAASKAASAGEGAAATVKAAAARPVAGQTGVLGARLIRQGEAAVPLHASANPAVRLVQQGYDKVIQHALDTNPEGRLAAHAAKRVAGSLEETQRRTVRMRDVPANMVESGGVKLGPRKASPARLVSEKVPRKVQEAALRLASENSAPEEAAAFHRTQADKGVNPKENLKQAAIYDRVAHHGLLTQDEAGNVIVDAERHPHLAAVDAMVAHGQSEVDQIAKDYKLMTAEGLTARRNGPARIRAGATFENPTPAKEGLPSQALVKQRAAVVRLGTLHDRALGKAQAAAGEGAIGTKAITPGKAVTAAGGARAERLGSALSVAKDKLQQMEAGAAARVKPTGIVGGETARSGRGYVTYRTQEPRAPKSRIASAAGPVVGKVKSFIPKKRFTGEGLQAGKVPDNTTRLVAQHMRDAYRYVNTDEGRRAFYQTGSATKRSSRDVLLRDPGAEDVGKVTPQLDELLGRKGSTLDQLPAPELDAVAHGFEAFRQHLVPGLTDHFAREKAADIGTAAPEGYRFVDRKILGDLARPTRAPLTGIGHAADKVNTAVTAATVYFKLGHVGTRFLTNASTNIIQGSARPTEISKSLDLWKQLTPLERAKSLAAAGQHSFHALPLTDETGAVSKVISGAGRVGANWWAKHADSPFRFNSLAYEARKAGFDTPDKFRELLDKLENPHDHNMNAAEAAKVDWVGKRANREGIAYDRLSHAERTYITRAFWFWPWVSGASRFAVNTAFEHPYKSAVLANAGVQGRKTQALELGDLPSYEGGLVKLAGGGDHPLVTDLSTFSPFATPADVLQTPEFGTIASFLNPVYAAGTQLAMRENQYGQHTNKPLGDAVSSLFSPTPEAQVLNAFLQRKQDQSKRMFHKTVGNMLARAAGGPAVPRDVNLTAAHSAAARERAGR